MTSPIPREIKAACRAALPGVLRAHGLDATARVLQDEEGWVNPCYLVGDDLVVRFNSRDADQPKFGREVNAYGLARERGVPVPEVIVHDPSRRHAPYEVLVLARLPGETVERSWDGLDGPTRTRLATRMGELMATLHEIDPGGFGELALPAKERTQPLAAIVMDLLEARLADARASGVLTDRDAAAARRVVGARLPSLADVDRPSLVHGDLHLGNVLHVDGEVTGLLDFEWSRAGDPAEELISSQCVRDLWPDAWDPWMAAYRRARPERPSERARRQVHAVLHNVMMSVVSHRHFPQEAEGTRAATRSYLASLDAEPGPEE